MSFTAATASEGATVVQWVRNIWETPRHNIVFTTSRGRRAQLLCHVSCSRRLRLRDASRSETVQLLLEGMIAHGIVLTGIVWTRAHVVRVVIPYQVFRT